MVLSLIEAFKIENSCEVSGETQRNQHPFDGSPTLSPSRSLQTPMNNKEKCVQNIDNQGGLSEKKPSDLQLNDIKIEKETQKEGCDNIV